MAENPPSSDLPVASASVPPSLTAGTLVDGKYELSRKLGRGAMGEVWAARHVTIGQEVAVKLVMREVDNGDGTSAESRFLLEAQVAAALSRRTRHIVSVTDHGQDGALGYLVMELLVGEPLDVLVKRTGALSLADATTLVSQIARGLAAAHEAGVMHRDLKPSNIFVTHDDAGASVAKILDFGIAKLRAGHGRRAAFATQRGFLLGTPAYMSPEQARGGKTLDHRADVWALAVIAYHLLTGEFPFDGGSPDELFARIVKIQPIPVHERQPLLPQVVADFFARAFARRIEDRFQSATTLAAAFEQLTSLAERGEVVLPAPTLLAAGAMRAPLPTPVESSRPLSYGPPSSDSTIRAPGVPGRRRVLKPLLAGLLVGGVLASTIAVLSVYYEGDAARAPARLTSSLAPVLAPVSDGSREAVPPPDPPSASPAEPDGEPITVSVPALPRRPARPSRTSSAEPAARQARLPWEKGDIF
ncbi:MAG: hypothetical protein JWP97_1274 [Labilithrix sp.]|nr:hypothetical protein [Labilithrix sp.]